MTASGKNKVVVLIVVLAAALAVVGYFVSSGSKSGNVTVTNAGNVNGNEQADANGNVNIDSDAVTNSAPVNENVNARSNTDATANANGNINAAAPELTYEEQLSMEASIDWKTYADEEVGYTVKYPKDWTVEATVMTRNEALVNPVRYLTLYAPSNSHALVLGVKRSTDEFLISDRAGVAAGDFVRDGNVTVADTLVPASKLVYKGKVKEWYASENGPGPSTVGTHVINASFAASSTGDSVDLTGSPALATAKVILSTLNFTK